MRPRLRPRPDLDTYGRIGPRDPGHENLHRQFFGTLDYDAWMYVFRVNTFGPDKMAEALLPNLLAGEQKKIVNLSSTIGSLGCSDPGTRGSSASHRISTNSSPP